MKNDWKLLLNNPESDLDRSRSDHFSESRPIGDLEGRSSPSPLPYGRATGILYPDPDRVDVAFLDLMTPRLPEPGNTLANRIPFLSHGLSNDLTLKSGIEYSAFTGSLTAVDSLGQEFSFFDPTYFINHPHYRSGQKIRFELAALGWEVEEAEETMESARGTLFQAMTQSSESMDSPPDVAMSSFTNSRAFGFLESLGNDEYRFQAVVRNPRPATTFSRCRPIMRYEISWNNSLSIALYISAQSSREVPLRHGTVVRGRLRLQGVPISILESPACSDVPDKVPHSGKQPASELLWISSKVLNPSWTFLCLGKRALAHLLDRGGWKVGAYPNPRFAPGQPDLVAESPSRGLKVGFFIRTGITGIQPRIPYSDSDRKLLSYIMKRDYGIPLTFFPEMELKPVEGGFRVEMLQTDGMEKRLPRIEKVQWIRMENRPEAPVISSWRPRGDKCYLPEGKIGVLHLLHHASRHADFQSFSKQLSETVSLESVPHRCHLRGKQAVQEHLSRIFSRHLASQTAIRSTVKDDRIQVEFVSRTGRDRMQIHFEQDGGYISRIRIDGNANNFL